MMSVPAGQDGSTEREEVAAQQEVELEAAVAESERQTLFTDAVVAIAITLLALELPVPEGTTNHELLEAVRHDYGEYFGYVLSFVVIAQHWGAHHRAFKYVRGFSPLVGKLNLLWLFMQVTTPFATKVIAGEGAHAVRFAFYGLIQALASLILVLMIQQLSSDGNFRRGTHADLPRRIQMGLLGTGTGFLLSVPLFFVWHDAWLLWIAIPFVNHFLRRRRFPVLAGSVA